MNTGILIIAHESNAETFIAINAFTRREDFEETVEMIVSDLESEGNTVSTHYIN